MSFIPAPLRVTLHLLAALALPTPARAAPEPEPAPEAHPAAPPPVAMAELSLQLGPGRLTLLGRPAGGAQLTPIKDIELRPPIYEPLFVSPTLAYVPYSEGVAILDLSSPQDARIVRRFSVGDHVIRLRRAGSAVWLTLFNDDQVEYDLGQPLAPLLIQRRRRPPPNLGAQGARQVLGGTLLTLGGVSAAASVYGVFSGLRMLVDIRYCDPVCHHERTPYFINHPSAHWGITLGLAAGGGLMMGLGVLIAGNR